MKNTILFFAGFFGTLLLLIEFPAIAGLVVRVIYPLTKGVNPFMFVTLYYQIKVIK
jgi:hypothetical protein